MLSDILLRHRARGQMLWDADGAVALRDVAAATSLDAKAGGLRGRSLVIHADDQMTAALALIELDGVARRLVICPPDARPAQMEAIVADAEADALITGARSPFSEGAFGRPAVRCGLPLKPRPESSGPELATEWVLQTSGTTGPPKMVAHSLAALSRAFASAASRDAQAASKAAPQEPSKLWSTFYDIRRYGGLQIFLRAVMCGDSLALSRAGEPLSDQLRRLGERGVTHMSGTPSHWRRALMAPEFYAFRPRYVRLSGEIADQAVLDGLRAAFPEAAIVHAYASTEAGVAFEVADGREGFPADLVDEKSGDVEMEVADGALRIRSGRTATRYIGRDAPELKDERGFVVTSDMVVRRGDRLFFAGRGDGVVNVGGMKVHPEEVEAVINAHRRVRMSLVKGRRNPFTGEIVVADVVLRDPLGQDDATLKGEIMEMCRNVLAVHKAPAMIRFVDRLEISETGKIVRRHA
jgi:acyl-coenzyme A synthetase/AMP-(fatty) acid ligase